MKRFLSEFQLWFCNHVVNKIPSHTIRLGYYRKIMKFKIGTNSSILLGCTFDAKGGFIIGKNSTINQNCRIDTRGEVSIGDNVSISAETIILTADHDIQSEYFTGRNKKVFIEDYAFVGTRALILPGTFIIVGGVLAAGSVLTKGINSYEIFAGTPAKKINDRTKTLNYNPGYRRLFH